MTAAKSTSMHPISQLLCDTYAELHKQGQVAFPLHEKQRGAIDAIVKTVEAEYFEVPRHGSPIDKAVAYLCLIIKDHPVTDGNKRLALLWFRIYCIVYKLDADPAPYSYDQIAVAIEKDKVSRMEELHRIVRLLLFEQ